MTQRWCALSGAAGYLGARVEAALDDAGWSVRRLVRAPSQRNDVAFELGGTISPRQFQGCEAFVHCAHDFRAAPLQQRRINLEGGIAAMQSARSAGVRAIVFVSTVSAYPGCQSEYGRTKLELEQFVASAGGVSVRPGLIWGRKEHGVLRALSRAATSPVVPVFDGGRQPFVLGHVDDVAVAVVAALGRTTTRDELPRVAAHSRRWTFAQLLAAIAAGRGRRLRTFSLPGRLALHALRATEIVGLRLPLHSDNLLGLLFPSPRFGPFCEDTPFREFDPGGMTTI